jgi:hypothetical protein
MYRLGIVYILNDDTLTPVFNLRGCNFDICNSNMERDSYDLVNLYADRATRKQNYLERDSFLTNGLYLDNTFGVFKNPKISLYDYEGVKPIGYKITLSPDVMYELHAHNIKGYFIVRQKRIPTILAQGLAIGIDNSSYIPMLKTSNPDKQDQYSTESFLNSSRILTADCSTRMINTSNKQGSALLCLDANVVPTLQSMLDGSLFVLETVANYSRVDRSGRHYKVFFGDHYSNKPSNIKSQAIFVNSDTPLK